MLSLSLSLSSVHANVFLLLCLLSSASVVVVIGFWWFAMGFFSWFYVEAKAFELSVVEGG